MAALLFIIGCCLGSFMNVVLSRKDWYKGRSRCDVCGYTLKWYDLIPIISFCILRGKCCKCHAKIDVLHIASEVYMGCGFAAAYHYFQYDITAAVCITAAVVFLGIYAICDTKENAVSEIYLYGGIIGVSVLRMICFLRKGDIPGMSIFIVTYSIIYVGFRIVAKKAENHIGEGDFDILLLILLTIGFFNTMMCITIASVIGTCLYLPLIINKNYDRTKPIPLAPLLYVGFVTTILGGIVI